MALLGFALERLIPEREQPGSNRALNIPYSALVLVFVGAIFPVQIAIAETITGWLGVRNIFNLNFETGGSIPLVVLAMLASITRYGQSTATRVSPCGSRSTT